MYLIDPLFPINENSINDTKPLDLGVDFSYFSSDKAVITPKDDGITKEDKPKRKYTKRDKQEVASVDIVDQNIQSIYSPVFNDTDNELKKAIMQTDILASEIKDDVDKIRSSATIKNKYTYITNLTSTMGTLINTKVQAIREMNNSKVQAIRLELDRQKAFKDDTKNQNDDMRIMDLYNSFVNAPMGAYNPNPAPSIRDLSGAKTDGMIGNVIYNGIDMDGGIEPSVISQEQMTMRAAEDKSLKTVVRYNAETGARMFDIINVNTGMSVPGVERPDDFLLQDTILDVHNGVAKNRNIGAAWELLVEGSSIEEY